MNPTRAESKRMDGIKELCICMACRQRGLSVSYVEVHHLNLDGKAGQKRLGHRYTIGLCPWHHRGVTNGLRADVMQSMLGPSLANGSKPFRAEFGSDMELLAVQDRLIGWEDEPF